MRPAASQSRQLPTTNAGRTAAKMAGHRSAIRIAKIANVETMDAADNAAMAARQANPVMRAPASVLASAYLTKSPAVAPVQRAKDAMCRAIPALRARRNARDAPVAATGAAGNVEMDVRRASAAMPQVVPAANP